MANSKTETGTRAETIRRFVGEMQGLMADRHVAQRRITALARRVHKELGLAPSDFTMGVRLAILAERGKQDAVNSIREIMLALGNSLPAIAEEPTPTKLQQNYNSTPEAPVRKRDLVVQALLTHGPMTAAELQRRLGSEFPVAPHLTHLEHDGRVRHQGTQWSAD
jgi:hypothetical protein